MVICTAALIILVYSSFMTVADSQRCTPADCTYTDDLNIVVKGKCNKNPTQPFRSEVGVEECKGAGCKCFIKGCFPRYCNGGQGICRTQRIGSEKEITDLLPYERCGDKCNCYGQGEPRDCMDGNRRGICSRLAQGIFKVPTGQRNCAAGKICFTKGIPSDDCNDPVETPWIWGDVNRLTSGSGRHICLGCMKTKPDSTNLSPGDAKYNAARHSQRLRENDQRISTTTVFAAGRPNHIVFKSVMYKNKPACEIVDPVETWECDWQEERKEGTRTVKGQFKCEHPRKCTLCRAIFAKDAVMRGHYYPETLKG